MTIPPKRPSTVCDRMASSYHSKLLESSVQYNFSIGLVVFLLAKRVRTYVSFFPKFASQNFGMVVPLHHMPPPLQVTVYLAICCQVIETSRYIQEKKSFSTKFLDDIANLNDTGPPIAKRPPDQLLDVVIAGSGR